MPSKKFKLQKMIKNRENPERCLKVLGKCVKNRERLQKNKKIIKHI
jgi:hypothetical protein